MPQGLRTRGKGRGSGGRSSKEPPEKKVKKNQREPPQPKGQERGKWTWAIVFLREEVLDPFVHVPLVAGSEIAEICRSASITDECIRTLVQSVTFGQANPVQIKLFMLLTASHAYMADTIVVHLNTYYHYARLAVENNTWYKCCS